jgi:FixJ family two-component response regulator
MPFNSGRHATRLGWRTAGRSAYCASASKRLSPREREVMVEVVKGRLNKQIAGDIGISEIMVKVHRGQVMRKMKAASLPDLARMADKLQPVPDQPPTK